jgi:hypothetical protein
LKSGREGKSPALLKSSSYRSQKYPLLKEKIQFFDKQGKLFGHYLYLVEYKDEVINKQYTTVYLVESKFIKASSFKWEEYFNKHGKLTRWKTNENKDGVSMVLEKGTSEQFWITMNANMFETIAHNANDKRIIELCKVERNL